MQESLGRTTGQRKTGAFEVGRKRSRMCRYQVFIQGPGIALKRCIFAPRQVDLQHIASRKAFADVTHTSLELLWGGRCPGGEARRANIPLSLLKEAVEGAK